MILRILPILVCLVRLSVATRSNLQNGELQTDLNGTYLPGTSAIPALTNCTDPTHSEESCCILQNSLCRKELFCYVLPNEIHDTLRYVIYNSTCDTANFTVIKFAVLVDSKHSTGSINLTLIQHFPAVQALCVFKSFYWNGRGFPFHFTPIGKTPSLPLRELHYNVPLPCPCVFSNNMTGVSFNPEFSAFLGSLHSLAHLNFAGTRQLQMQCVPSILKQLPSHTLCTLVSMDLSLSQTTNFPLFDHSFSLSHLLQEVRQKCPNGASRLETLDFSNNAFEIAIANFYSLIPELKIFSLSSNNIHSMVDGWAMEILFHPNVQVIDFSNQAMRHVGGWLPGIYVSPGASDKVDQQDDYPQEQNARLFTKPKEEGIVYDYETTLEMFRMRAQAAFGKFPMNCTRRWFPDARSFTNSTAVCMCLQCVQPLLFKNIDCAVMSNATLNWVLGLFDVTETCVFSIYLPLGKNLRNVTLDNLGLVSLDYYMPKKETTRLCVAQNSLAHISFRYNAAWVKSAGLGQVLSYVSFNGAEDPDSHQLQYMDVSYNSVPIRNVSGIFNMSGNLILDGNYVKTLPMNLCKERHSLEMVSLRDCKVRSVPPHFFTKCLNMTFIDLRGNNLTDVTFSLPKLENKNLTLHLSYTSLDQLDVVFRKEVDRFTQKNHLFLNLTGNQFLCRCKQDSRDFISWVQRDAVRNINLTLLERDSYICLYQPHSGATIQFRQIVMDKTLLHRLHYECDVKPLRSILVPTLSSLGILLLLAAIVLVFRHRYKIQHRWIQLQRYLRFRGSADWESMDFRYDAFVSYCASDRFWVHHLLMRRLEVVYGFKLCIHYRDFPVGDVIYTSIMDAMQHSRIIIIVTSAKFYQRVCCQFEVLNAYNLFQRGRQILLVSLDDQNMAQIEDLPPTMQYLEQNCPTLPWPTDPGNNQSTEAFWKTLRACMYGENNVVTGSCNNCCRRNYENLDDDARPLVVN